MNHKNALTAELQSKIRNEHDLRKVGFEVGLPRIMSMQLRRFSSKKDSSGTSQLFNGATIALRLANDRHQVRSCRNGSAEFRKTVALEPTQMWTRRPDRPCQWRSSKSLVPW